ncbi:MAG: hypothetical protein RL329_2166 [Bacteroidota bacterium]
MVRYSECTALKQGFFYKKTLKIWLFEVSQPFGDDD